MSPGFTRRDALVAIAAATGRSGDVDVADAPTGVVVIDDHRSARLELVQFGGVRTADTWQFDNVPRQLADAVPAWTGFLVHADPAGEVSLVRLGDREALKDRWNDLVQWLEPDDLATLIGRYFGRDAGLDAHQTVLAETDEFLGLVAPEARKQIAATLPATRLQRTSEGVGTLEFVTYFLSANDPAGPHRLGLTRWTADWGPDRPLGWGADIVRRGIPSIYSPPSAARRA